VSTHVPARRITHAVFALALVLAAWLPVALQSSAVAAPLSQGGAAGSGPAVAVHAGFGDQGTYLMGKWFPVRVTLANPQGAASMRVRVEVDFHNENSQVAGTYGRGVDLPSPSRKEVTLYSYSGSFDRAITVRVVENGAVVKSVDTRIDPLDPTTDFMLGVVSPDQSLLNILGGEKVGHTGTPYSYSYRPGPAGPTSGGGRVSLAQIAADDLPTEPAALDGFAALAIEDTRPDAVSPEQRSAVTRWVQRGGQLILIARPGGADPTVPFEGISPVTVSGPRDVSSLQSLAELVNAFDLTDGASVIGSTLKQGPGVRSRALAVEDGVPLVAERRVGDGRVTFLAVSPGLPPLETWDGLVPLFKRLLVQQALDAKMAGLRTPGFTGFGYLYATPGVFDVSGNIFDLPGLDLPDAWGLALFLLVYIVVIGPVNFIVLRRIRRTELAWLTIPVLVLAFSAGAYTLAYGVKGGDIVVPRATITRAEPGAPSAESVQFWGIFSPLRRAYSLSLDSGSMVSGFQRYNYGSPGDSPFKVVAGPDSTRIESVVVDTGNLTAFMSEGAVKGSPPLEVDLRPGDDRITGTVKNVSSSVLRDVVLLRGDEVQYVGAIGPGQSVAANLGISRRPLSNGSPQRVLPPPSGVSAPPSGQTYVPSQSPAEREYGRRVGVLNMAIGPLVSNDPPASLDVLVLAWGAAPPLGLTVESQKVRNEQLDLWTMRVPVVARAGEGAKLAGGSVPLWVYVPGGDPGWFAGVPSASFTLAPYADVHFELPVGARPSDLSLTWQVNPAPDLDVLAFNNRSGHWDVIDAGSGSASTGARTARIDNPLDYVAPDGQVVVRLLARNATLGVQISTLELAMVQ
jgi:hypothetical protein